jgi:nucleoside-diphosphate-sugar epimerase
MTHVVAIGSTGHVGTYLVPRLVAAGYEVTAVSRGHRDPYQPHAAWNSVRKVTLDRVAEDQNVTFGQQIRDLKPDIVVDMICFTLASAQHLVNALRGQVQHFLYYGSIWVHGHSVEVPTTEMQPRYPVGEYGIQKAAIEAYLLDEARRNGFPATALHPGHIVGPGWEPVNPAGNFDPEVFTTLAQGKELPLPNIGLETVHHVHADDVAQITMQAIANWSNAVGQSFHAVSPAAVTLRGYAETVAGWFGRKANLRFLPWNEWEALHSESEAQQTWGHITHSPNCSIAKAERLLDYRPRYSSYQAVYEAVTWLVDQGIVKT